MREVSEMISDIQLTDKTNTLSSKLSGGMKKEAEVYRYYCYFLPLRKFPSS